MMTLTSASAADLATLAADLASQDLFVRYGQTVQSLERRWQGALQSGEPFLVAQRATQPVGLCWFSTRGVFATGGYLRLIAVSEEAQGAGVGALLLQGFENACAKPPGGWFLLTSDFNAAAQRFYVRHGYRRVGELPGFARPEIAEHIYWKPLS